MPVSWIAFRFTEICILMDDVQWTFLRLDQPKANRAVASAIALELIHLFALKIILIAFMKWAPKSTLLLFSRFHSLDLNRKLCTFEHLNWKKRRNNQFDFGCGGWIEIIYTCTISHVLKNNGLNVRNGVLLPWVCHDGIFACDANIFLSFEHAILSCVLSLQPISAMNSTCATTPNNTHRKIHSSR